MKCLQAGPDVCLDRTLLIEASEGLEKTKKDAECMKQQAAELLGRRTSSDIDCAVTVREILGVVSTAQDIPCLFTKFAESRNSSNRNKSGAGLGFAFAEGFSISWEIISGSEVRAWERAAHIHSSQTWHMQ
ncbi:hypothetical protein Pfo_006108 [Paulownia fortunei]|nr:hypothetical protein Pfo_006108 [Paulownia fortunei]